MRRDIYLFPSIAVASNIVNILTMLRINSEQLIISGLSQSCRSNSEKHNNRHFDDICPRLLLSMEETDRVAIMLFKLKSVKVNKYNFLS